MSARPSPVPPANRSPKGTGSQDYVPVPNENEPSASTNQVGDTGNTHQNTTNQSLHKSK